MGHWLGRPCEAASGALSLDLIDLLTAPYDAFNWVTDALFLAVNDLFGRYGLPIVFLAALAEATIGIGVVFPGVVIMFLGGAAAAKGDGNILVVLAAASLGTCIGDTVSYAAGRWGAQALYASRLGPSLRLGATLMEGRAMWLIPFYHLHSVTRTLGPFGSGALRLPLRVWIPLDYVGAVIANLVWAGGGFILGTAVLQEDGTLHQHPAIRLGLVALAMVWFVAMQRVFQRRLAAIRGAAAQGDGDAPGAVTPEQTSSDQQRRRG